MMFTLLPLFMAFTFVASSSYCHLELEEIKAKIGHFDKELHKEVDKDLCDKELHKELQAIKANNQIVVEDKRNIHEGNKDLDQHVYFLATFQSPETTVHPGTVVFDKVLANTGNAYNPSSGTFTAPRPGLYAFTVQAFNRDSGESNFDLHVNGQMALRARSVTPHTNSNYVFPVILKSGDIVSVYNRYGINIWGTDHSMMAGWLIKAL